MFSSTTPLNWHGTLKRLKKDYTPGTLGRELGIGVQNNILDVARGWPTKKKPSAVYAEAVSTQVQAVEKKHKLQRLSKLDEVGASNAEQGAALPNPGSPGSPGLTSPKPIVTPAARRITLDPAPASLGAASKTAAPSPTSVASSKTATAELFRPPPELPAKFKSYALKGAGAAAAKSAAKPEPEPETKEKKAAKTIIAATKRYMAKQRARARLTVEELASPAGPPNPTVAPATVRVRHTRQVPFSPRRVPRKAKAPGAPRIDRRLAPMRIKGQYLYFDRKTPRKPRKGRREEQVESNAGQNLIQLFDAEVKPKKAGGVGPSKAPRLRRLTVEQEQAQKAQQAATKIQKLVRGRAVRKTLKPVPAPVAEPAPAMTPEPAPMRNLGIGPKRGRSRRLTVEQVQALKAAQAATKIQKIVRGRAVRKQAIAAPEPVQPAHVAPAAHSPSRAELEALAPGELKAHYTRITGNKGKPGRAKMLYAIIRAKGW